jgi:hypothetical protein
MLRFASQEWVAELDACLARVASPLDSPPLVLRYVITDPPGGGDSTACYRIELEGGRLRAAYGDDADQGPAEGRASVTFTQPYAVAAAIAAGELAAQTAILDGRLRVDGAVASLATWRRCLPGLDAALGDLRARTEY